MKTRLLSFILIVLVCLAEAKQTSDSSGNLPKTNKGAPSDGMGGKAGLFKSSLDSVEKANAEFKQKENMALITATINAMNKPKDATSGKNPISSTSSLLAFIALGAILGMSGQVVRVVIGLKKAKSTSTPDKPYVMDSRQMLLSLFIALIIGAVAGVLTGVNSLNSVTTIDKSTVFAFLASGYAGTDFIEGFIIT